MRVTIEPPSLKSPEGIAALTIGAIGVFLAVLAVNWKLEFTGFTDPTDTATTDTASTISGDPREKLYFNGWIEGRGLARPKPLTRVLPGWPYTFSADLGYWRAQNISSFEAGPDLLLAIASAPPEQTVLHAYVRPILLGRGLDLLAGELNVEVWRDGDWQPLGRVDGMVPFDIDLGRMRRAERLRRAEPTDVRFAGIRFGVRAQNDGCAAVALSIWNEEKTLPLDSVVFPVTVGDAECPDTTPNRSRNVAGLTRLLSQRPDATFDAALHIFEYGIPGRESGAVAVYVPSQPDGGCTHYVWEPTRAISDVISTPGFMVSLEDARTNRRYRLLANTLKNHLFPGRQPEVQCGDVAALQHLVRLSRESPPRLFVRLIGDGNETLFVPLGIAFMARGPSERLFAHLPIVTQALPRETYHIARCVADLVFAIPPKLDAVDSEIRIEPSPLFRPIPAIRDVETFMNTSEDQPVTLVLLAHHGRGLIHFDEPAVQWDVSFLKRRFKPGSIAVLSTCSAGSPDQGQMRLVRGLNAAGIDAMLLSSFDVKPTPGIVLAKSMAAELVAARSAPRALTLLEVYEAARRKAIVELAKAEGEETAEGLISEFSLAGNGGIRICGKED